MMVKNKFVLVDNEIILGRVVYHRELHKSPNGGGWWYYHKEQNKLILYGNSFDFGACKPEEILKAEITGSLGAIEDLIVVFDQRSNLEVLNIFLDHLGEEEAFKSISECDYI